MFIRDMNKHGFWVTNVIKHSETHILRKGGGDEDFKI